MIFNFIQTVSEKMKAAAGDLLSADGVWACRGNLRQTER